MPRRLSLAAYASHYYACDLPPTSPATIGSAWLYPPPHCRSTNRGISAASRTFEKQTEVHTLFRLDHSHVAYFVICERTIVDGHIVDHAGIADGEQGHADFSAEDGLAIAEGKRQYAL